MNRYKARRILEAHFKELNIVLENFKFRNPFHFEYTMHFVDDCVKRGIDPGYVNELLNKSLGHVETIDAFLDLPYPPHLDIARDPNVEYRPIRLEITDGKLWLGITSSKPSTDPTFNVALTCRMGFINPIRLQSKVTTQVIKVD